MNARRGNWSQRAAYPIVGGERGVRSPCVRGGIRNGGVGLRAVELYGVVDDEALCSGLGLTLSH